MTALPVDRRGSAINAALPGDERIPALDGLRGVAVLLVVIFHVFVVTAQLSNHRVDRLVTDVTSVGWTGVDLFFVLSGFLITGILVDAKSSTAPFFRTFYARRSLRIFPIYFLLLLGLLLVLPEVRNLDPQRLANFRDHHWWYWLYGTNIHTAIGGGENRDLIETWHLWSLAVEEQFYLVWPACVFLLPRRGMFALCIACIIGAFVLRIVMVASDVHPAIVLELTPARIDTLATGALLALIARTSGGLRRLEPWILPAAAASAGVCAVLIALQGGELTEFDPGVQTIGFSAIALLFGALLVATVRAEPTSKLHQLMTFPSLRMMGRYSYAMYVFHWPILTTINVNNAFVNRFPEIGGSIIVARVLLAVISFIASLAVAWLSWHLLEKHILKLKDRFPYDKHGERDDAPLAPNQPPAGTDAVAPRPTSNF